MKREEKLDTLDSHLSDLVTLPDWRALGSAQRSRGAVSPSGRTIS